MTGSFILLGLVGLAAVAWFATDVSESCTFDGATIELRRGKRVAVVQLPEMREIRAVLRGQTRAWQFLADPISGSACRRNSCLRH